MKKLIKGLMVSTALVMMCFMGTGYAQDMSTDVEYGEGDYSIGGVTLWIDGWVAVDGTYPPEPVFNATVTCATCSPPVSTTTDINGWYRLVYHSYCGSKTFVIQADGFTTQNVSVSDHTCPKCNCDYGDDYCYDQHDCQYHIRRNFYLDAGGNIDTDGDGRFDHIDNCFEVPNAWKLGTCTRGFRGHTCMSNDDCGCDGYCSKAQEDCDVDGIGNACDECVVTRGGCKAGPCPQFQSFAEISPAHKLLSPEATTLMSAEDKRLFWFMVMNQWWMAHNATSYNSIFDAMRGLFNGPDILCKELVRDKNNNGISDDEEGIHYGAEENLIMLQEAFKRCRDKFDNECSDPDYREENPFDCMW